MLSAIILAGFQSLSAASTISVSLGPINRARISVVPPGGNGTISLSGFVVCSSRWNRLRRPNGRQQKNDVSRLAHERQLHGTDLH
jgi:hypothetical protein